MEEKTIQVREHTRGVTAQKGREAKLTGIERIVEILERVFPEPNPNIAQELPQTKEYTGETLVFMKRDKNGEIIETQENVFQSVNSSFANVKNKQVEEKFKQRGGSI